MIKATHQTASADEINKATKPAKKNTKVQSESDHHSGNGEWLASPTAEIQPATAFTPEPISWLWPGWLARGKLHLVAGAAGTGKTTIALALTAELSSGGRWPSGEQIEPANVLIWSGEDDIKDTLLPRML